MEKPDLAPRLTIPELVRAYNAAVADIRAAFATVHAAEASLKRNFSDYVGVYNYSNQSMCWEDPKDTLEKIRRRCWASLVDRLELRRMMSIERARKLDEQLERGELPEITEENVAAFVEGYASQLPEMLAEAVGEVFEWLRPHANSNVGKLKTNSELEIGRKVILGWVVDDPTWGSTFRVNYNYDKELTALENVFTALDGKGQITKTHRSALSNAINATPRHSGLGETEYFRFKCCKNRNLHLEFKRLDLLDRFNKIAGGRRLRPKKSDAA